MSTAKGSTPAASAAGYDVIIVGFGAAGVSAAIEAAGTGAHVLVLDRGFGGGATALSGGIVYAGGGTSVQAAAAVDDHPENIFQYLRQEVRGAVGDETLRTFCESSPGMIDWLSDKGLRSKAFSLRTRPHTRPTGTTSITPAMRRRTRIETRRGPRPAATDRSRKASTPAKCSTRV